MFESLSQRTVIIGNSGAGKGALAESLSALVHVPVIDLDLLNWEGDEYGRKRDDDAARRMTLDVSAQPLWIIEGVYGWLAESALPRATALIWLDLQWSLCHAGLLARGPRRGATDQDGAELLKWAETYWNSADVEFVRRSLTDVYQFSQDQIQIGEPGTGDPIAS